MGRKRVRPRISYEWQAHKIVKLKDGKEALRTDIEKKPEIKDPNPSFAKIHQKILDKRRKNGKGYKIARRSKERDS